jgi:hypothetical protein
MIHPGEGVDQTGDQPALIVAGMGQSRSGRGGKARDGDDRAGLEQFTH